MELFDALNSTDVHHIILGHVEDGFELTEEALPHLGVTIDNRYVLLEGEYPGTPYIDVSFGLAHVMFGSYCWAWHCE